MAKPANLVHSLTGANTPLLLFVLLLLCQQKVRIVDRDVSAGIHRQKQLVAVGKLDLENSVPADQLARGCHL